MNQIQIKINVFIFALKTVIFVLLASIVFLVNQILQYMMVIVLIHIAFQINVSVVKILYARIVVVVWIVLTFTFLLILYPFAPRLVSVICVIALSLKNIVKSVFPNIF